MSSRGQSKRGDPPTWKLDEGITTSHRKILVRLYYEVLHMASDFYGFFGTIQRVSFVNGDEYSGSIRGG
jgi:hypothetical protein